MSITLSQNLATDMPEVGLVTFARLPILSDGERLVLDALSERGINAIPVVWDDPDVDWAAFTLCVVRSTWDYHLRPDDFIKWLEKAGALTSLWNPPDIIRWNIHKSYLRDL